MWVLLGRAPLASYSGEASCILSEYCDYLNICDCGKWWIYIVDTVGWTQRDAEYKTKLYYKITLMIQMGYPFPRGSPQVSDTICQMLIIFITSSGNTRVPVRTNIWTHKHSGLNWIYPRRRWCGWRQIYCIRYQSKQSSKAISYKWLYK